MAWMTPSAPAAGEPLSTTDPRFLATVESWFKTQPEILILIRYSHAAGSKDFEFFSAFTALRDRLRQLAASTSISAFRQHQLPMRGVVDDEFVAKCLNCIPDKTEFLLLETEPSTAGGHSWFRHTGGESHAELREVLQESLGRRVAVGTYPPFWEDGPDVLSAIVPDNNGAVARGVY